MAIMKTNRNFLLFIIIGALGASTWFLASNDIIGKIFNNDDPDRSPNHIEIDREPAHISMTGLVPGPDAIVGNVFGLAQFGSIGTQVGLAMGTEVCNAGTVDIDWFALPNNAHPVVPQNLYRLSGGASGDDRFEQVGQSNVAHAFFALAQNSCGFGCNGANGSHLGSGCSNPDSPAYNAGPNLGSRAWINPFTGFFPGSNPNPNDHSGHSHNGSSHRILVEINDLNTTLNQGATYYAEAGYITPHESSWCQANAGQCNMYNNVSYRQFNVTGTSTFSFSPIGSTVQTQPAIYAWPGATKVQIEPDPGNDGIGVVGYKVTNPSPGVWHYEYAVYNENIDRAIQSFSIPVGANVTLSNIGFHAPPQHPGWTFDGTVGNAGFSSTPWTQTQAGDLMTWSSETFAQNQNANAIRWGTVYNFRFDSDKPPQNVTATIGFFKTGSPISVSVQGPSAGATLGNYPNTTLPLSTNTTVTPDTAPINTTSISVSTSTNFKGTLEGDPATGVVRVTDAHPSGTYSVTVRAFDSGGASATRTFMLTVTTPATCPVSFAAPVNFSVGDDPSSVAVGDFNRDGKQDLATANGTSNNVSILLGNGSGSFDSATNFDVGGSSTSSLAVGDFNGDGKQDLAVATGVDFVILPGNGAGSFGTPARFTAGITPVAIAVGDFNGDSKQDVAAANAFTDSVSILLGNGAGGFGSATSFGVGDYPISIVVADFNNDGSEDLATGNSANFTVSILLGNGTGNFGPATNLVTWNHIVSIAIGDFNGDGNQDIATADSLDAALSVLLGDGTGGFSLPTYFNTYYFPKSVVTGDFNGDGDEDLAAADTFLDIFLGDGGGGFALTTPFNGGDSTISVAVGDFNGDGRQDLVVGNGEGLASVSILLRNCISVSGTVAYGNALGNPPAPRYVSNVLVSGFGSNNVYTTTSFPGGTYMLEGFGPGSLIVTPAKSGSVNGSITSFDAALIAQHVAGGPLLTGNQLVVADVSGSGTLSSFDAGQIARYAAAMTGFGSTGNWVFNPVNMMYPSVTTNISGEDYSALLMGEVSGNWTNTGARPAEGTWYRQNSSNGGFFAFQFGTNGDKPTMTAFLY